MARLLAVCVTAGLILGLTGMPSSEAATAFRGLSLSTPYPAQTVRAGERVTLTLTVKNFGLGPQSVSLRVAEAASGWRAALLGGGRPISAVHVEPDQEVTVSLQLDPPAGATSGTFRFLVTAQGQGASAQLPIALTIGQVLPSRLTLTAELPVLRGTATTSFRYRLTLKNESDRDLLVSLEARTQRNFQVTFTPAFAAQQVTSLPVKAGESRDLDVEVGLPREVPAGNYEVTVTASAGEARAQIRLGLEVTGRADLTLTTKDERLSGRAVAGRATPFKMVVKNRGGAAASDVELTSTEPTGWEVKFEPARLEAVAPNQEREVTATIQPSSKALSGDYVVTLRASAGDVSSSADLRVTVVSSTLWGLLGILLVAIALGVVGLAVSRYGRR